MLAMREQKRKRRRGLRSGILSDLDRAAITTRERRINKNRFQANVSFRNKTATRWVKTYKKKNVWDYLAVGITAEQCDHDVIEDMGANGWILHEEQFSEVDNFDHVLVFKRRTSV